MEEPIARKNQNMAVWIVALAIAITCCSILFNIFANYLATINKNISLANARLTPMEQRENQLLFEIQSLHHELIANSPAHAPVTPASTGKPAAAPTSPAPSPTSPAAVPEIPAKH